MEPKAHRTRDSLRVGRARRLYISIACLLMFGMFGRAGWLLRRRTGARGASERIPLVHFHGPRRCCATAHWLPASSRRPALEQGHSARNPAIGLMRAARRAGDQLARRQIPMSSRGTARKTAGSRRPGRRRRDRPRTGFSTTRRRARPPPRRGACIMLSASGRSVNDSGLNSSPHQGQFSRGIGEGLRSGLRLNAVTFARAESGRPSPLRSRMFGVAAFPRS